MRKAKSADKLKNSYWLTHEKFGLHAKTLYSTVEDIPIEIGDFDIAVLAMVLTHMRDPAKAIEICARRSKKLIITDRLNEVPEDIRDQPVLWYVPHKDKPRRRGVWWYFTKGYFKNLLEGMGFSKVTFSEVGCPVRNERTCRATAIVAEW